MKVALFNISSTPPLDASALISSLLKQAGHQVVRVTCTPLTHFAPFLIDVGELEHSLKPVFAGVDVCMVSLFTNDLHLAIKVTEIARKYCSTQKVFWGGPHCISSPEASLQYADGVCYSEGDQAAVEVLARLQAGEEYWHTPSMAFKVGGQIIKNNPYPLITNLDTLPFPDMDMADHYVLMKRRLEPFTKQILRPLTARYPVWRPTLFWLSARGCPNVCSYCHNIRYVQIYGRNPVRFHSPKYMLDVLEKAATSVGDFDCVLLGDDDFMFRPQVQIEEFCEGYRKRIGLPLVIFASTRAFSESKFQMLLDAGLLGIEIGIQTGSDSLLKNVYNRPGSAKQCVEIIDKIASQGASSPGFELILPDFILDNPYETRNDIADTYKAILRMYHLMANRRDPWLILNTFFLTFSPGTPLTERAAKDGLIRYGAGTNPTDAVYHRRSALYQPNYETLLVCLLRLLNDPPLRHVPGFMPGSLAARYTPRFITRHLQGRSTIRFIPLFILRLLITKPVRAVANLVPQMFYRKIIAVIRNHTMYAGATGSWPLRAFSRKPIPSPRVDIDLALKDKPASP